MWKKFCNWLLYKKMGWTIEVTEDHPDKYIICLAPHTSNWDFILGQLYVGAQGMKSNFLMRRLGGIPVHRQKKTSMTDALAETAKAEPIFHLCITPEGTRSKTADWKKGFYFIALKAGMPILLYGIDYEKKHIQCTKTVIPSGDLDSDMRDIKLYYQHFKGKKPENFTIGELV